MKWTYILLFGLKIIFLIQFIFIIGGKYTIDRRVYLVTEILFKVCLALYIYHLILFSLIKIPFEDKAIIGFACGLLLYDALYNDMLEVIHYSGYESIGA
jgi:hypothetical protein